ncbi:hypothetical protein ABFY47_23910, partial [Enterobacter ludwigii]|uniref:hypothetical protein n=1 Tax=Enterobacter ludwigii TaxID=299767 RepID=UPI003D1A89CD
KVIHMVTKWIFVNPLIFRRGGEKLSGKVDVFYWADIAAGGAVMRPLTASRTYYYRRSGKVINLLKV